MMGSVTTEPAPSLPEDSVTRVERGSYQCPIASYPQHATEITTSAKGISETWVEQFNEYYCSGDYDSVKQLFTDECYWRDHLCVSWDFHTLHGPETVANLLNSGDHRTKIKAFTLDDSAEHTKAKISALDGAGKVPCVEAWLNVQTTAGNGRGVVRLVLDPTTGNPKAWTFFTTLRELTGYEEQTGSRRPQGVSHGGVLGRANWQDRFVEEREFKMEDPTVLILGL